MKSQIENVASQSLKIFLCLVMLFVFTIVQPVANIKAAVLPLPAEMAKDAFIGVVGGIMTLGAHGANQMDYLTEKSGEILNIASETWDLMSQDLKDNFAQSVSAVGDGIVLASDFITNVLDLIKPKYDSTTISTEYYDLVKTAGSAEFTVKNNSIFQVNFPTVSTTNKIRIVASENATLGKQLAVYNESGSSWGSSRISLDPQYSTIWDAVSNGTTTIDTVINYFQMLGYPLSLQVGGVALGGADATYNQIDNWVRQNLLPRIDAGEVIYPNTQAWSADGDRVFVNSDGSTLVLEDGTPYSGEYAWRKPVTGLVDGVPAVLDPATLTWKDIIAGTPLAVATATQVAEYVGVNETKAQEIINKTNNKKPSIDVDVDDDDGVNISIVITNDVDNDDSDGSNYSGGYRCVEKGQIVPCKDVEEIDGSLLAYVGNAYDYAVNAVKSGVDGVATITAGATGLIALYSHIFSWLPSEVTVILTSGLLLMIGLRVFRK